MRIIVRLDIGDDGLLPNGTSAFRVIVPDLGVSQYLYLPFDDFHRLFGAPEGFPADLLVLAGVCYVIDQVVARSLFPDRWTRDLEVCLPVRSPDAWNSLSDSIADMLSFLTGDHWTLYFVERNERIYWQQHRRLKSKSLQPATVVSLFSGGVDSLAGAIDHLENSSEPITLVGHYDLGSAAAVTQRFLATQLKQYYPGRINFAQERIGPLQKGGGNAPLYARISQPTDRESTFRSRSLVFLGLGTYFAAYHRWCLSAPLLIPENGLIALNPALTESRLGSCSTRTTHPLFLSKFNALLHAIGLDIQVRNPLSYKTKGEVVAHCSNQALLQRLLPYTVSCAHPTRRQGWIRKEAGHCGYCVPCLFRRASLHQIGLDRGEDYGIDVLSGELDLREDIASDFRAMLSWVYTVSNDEQLQSAVRRMATSPDFYPVACHVVEAGRDEVVKMVTDKADPSIMRWVGLA